MRFKLFHLFVVVLVCSFSAVAQTDLKVNEKAINASVAGGFFQIKLPVENLLNRRLSGNLSIQIIDENDTVIIGNYSSATVDKGHSTVER